MAPLAGALVRVVTSEKLEDRVTSKKTVAATRAIDALGKPSYSFEAGLAPIPMKFFDYLVL